MKKQCPLRSIALSEDAECLGKKCQWWLDAKDTCVMTEMGWFTTALGGVEINLGQLAKTIEEKDFTQY